MHDASTSSGLSGAESQPEPQGAGTAGLGSLALRNTALVLTARIGSRALALVTVVAIARHLDPDHFGRLQTLVAYTTLVTVLLDLGFNTLYVREAARAPADAGRFLGTLVPLRLLMAVPAFGVLAFVLRISDLESLLAPGFVLMLLASFASLLRGTFYARQSLRYEALSILLEAAILLSLVLAGIRTGAGVGYLVWAYAATYAFSCAFILAVILARRMVNVAWAVDVSLARRWLWKSLPFALTFVITAIYFKIDVPILQQLRSYTEVGWYTAAYKPFEALLFLPVTMLNVVFPVLSVYYRSSPARLVPAIEKFLKSLLLIGWPLTVGTFMLAGGLIGLLGLYAQAAPALAILALGIAFLFVNNAFIAALNSIDKQAAFTRAALASLAVNVALNLLLIPRFGYLGAAAATVLTEAFLAGAGWWLTARHLGRVRVLRNSWRVILAGLAMGLALLPARGLQGWAVVAAMLAGAAVYTLALLLLGAIDAEERALLRRALAGGRPL